MKNLQFFAKKRRKIVPVIGFVLSFLLVFTIFLTSVSAVYSQTDDANPETKPTEPPALIEDAPVVMDGEELFVIQDKIGTLTPQQRAQEISDTIIKIAQNRKLNSANIIPKDEKDRTDVVLRGQVIVSIFDVDAQSIADATEYVLKDPAPYVEHIAYNNFHATYKLSVYTHDSDKDDGICSEIRQKFQDLCAQEGIALVSPYYLASRDKSFSKILDSNRSSSGRMSEK